MFIKDEAKVASKDGIKRTVLYFSKLSPVTNEEKFCFRGVKNQEIGSHPCRDMFKCILLKSIRGIIIRSIILV